MESTRDPGLQPQRTGMAWSRTMFVMLINSLLFFRAGIADDDRVVFACGILLLCVACMMAVFAVMRYRFNAARHQILSRISRGLIAFTSVTIVIAALVLLYRQLAV
ncbi:DUF202 domain-containing protein [Brenneria izadpanahii]|uniref:DUF202 domain-containing protein n=1 Tax=Brenneria izadpanahii TaxID=2722756 RepID=A0ABX7UVQ8_9GAMM|nr:DUF202 domain-containing protein [Brenneria izadpanahii]QTF07788.1 DUF202 domain-containing protein [Brenneria izadpanahii]